MEKSPITDLIDRLGRRRLAEAVGVSISLVHKWATANRIPSRWQAAVVDFAQAQEGFTHVDAAWMINQHAEAAA